MDIGIKVSIMEYVSFGQNNFQWPQRQNDILFNQDEILCQIDCPVLIGRSCRGILGLLPDDFSRCNEALKNTLK